MLCGQWVRLPAKLPALQQLRHLMMMTPPIIMGHLTWWWCHAASCQPATSRFQPQELLRFASASERHTNSCPAVHLPVHWAQSVLQWLVPGLCVQVPGDGTASVHTSIGQWLRNASLHELLSALPAGQHMLKGSVIHRWDRSGVSHSSR